MTPSSWMTDLPGEVKQVKRLCDLSIPGSHDSFTFSLKRSGAAGPDQPKWIQKLTRLFPRYCLVCPVAVKTAPL